MNEISMAVSLIAAVSVAVERVTEILKQIFPRLAQPPANPDPTKRDGRTIALQLIALVAGIAIAALGKLEIAGDGGLGVYLLIGLLSAGGSKFWNNILEILKAMKISRQADAERKLLIRSQLEERVKALEAATAEAQERHSELLAKLASL